MNNTPSNHCNCDTQLIDKIAEHYRAILQLIGEDPSREGLVKTPRRAAKALLENTRGYRQDAARQVRRRSRQDAIGMGAPPHPWTKRRQQAARMAENARYVADFRSRWHKMTVVQYALAATR